SGVRNARRKALSNGPPERSWTVRRRPQASRGSPEWSFQVRVAHLGYYGTGHSPLCRTGAGYACGDTGRCPCRRILWSIPESGSLDAAASGLHLVLGGSGSRVHLQGDLDVDIAATEDLHGAVGPHRSLSNEVLCGDLAALGEQLRHLAQIDHLVLGAERVVEAPQLRQPHVQGRLTTLETRGHLAASLGALHSAAGCLALGAFTTTHPGLAGVCPGCRPQVVHLQRLLAAGVLFSHVSRPPRRRPGVPPWSPFLGPRVGPL